MYKMQEKLADTYAKCLLVLPCGKQTQGKQWISQYRKVMLASTLGMPTWQVCKGWTGSAQNRSKGVTCERCCSRVNLRL